MYQAIDNEMITVGALGVRFLVESGDSNGTASVFECYVPANARMPAPHSHHGWGRALQGRRRGLERRGAELSDAGVRLLVALTQGGDGR